MMKNLMMILGVLVVGCAGTTEPPVQRAQEQKVIYVDRYLSDCAHAVQRVAQVNICEGCSNFGVSAVAGKQCASGEE